VPQETFGFLEATVESSDSTADLPFLGRRGDSMPIRAAERKNALPLRTHPVQERRSGHGKSALPPPQRAGFAALLPGLWHAFPHGRHG
jgi:hypothetical protein